MSDACRVLPFEELHFFEELSSDACSFSETSNNERAKYLFRYLRDLGANTIVSEKDYTDGDYLEDYSAYYVRCHNKYSGHCKRIHIFGFQFDKKIFSRMITRDYSKSESTHYQAISKSYKGFVIARPLPKAIIGRTLLTSYSSDNGRRQYVTLRSYTVNLFGLQLEIMSLPFQEQDKVLAACATVALWSAFHKTADLFGTPAPRPAEITKIAYEAGGIDTRLFPSSGLTVRQMAHAIRSVGLEPELIEVSPSKPLVSIIYSYLKFGLPVVLGYNLPEIDSKILHAVTLTGYSIRKNHQIQREVSEDADSLPPFPGLRINEFYAHDDQIGPFSRLIVKESEESIHPIQFQRDKEGIVLPKWLIIPVYNKIRINFTCIQSWIERFWGGVLKELLETRRSLEWDSYLTRSNDLKKEFADSLRGHTKQQTFLLRQQPRFVWRVTLGCGSEKILELFGDATGLEHSNPFYEILWLDPEVENLVANKLEEISLPDAIDAANEAITPQLLKFLRENTCKKSPG
jgi:hypothetical protein